MGYVCVEGYGCSMVGKWPVVGGGGEVIGGDSQFSPQGDISFQ
jgi:hypothetical protein